MTVTIGNGQQPGVGRGITLKGELSSTEGWAALLSVAVWPSRERSEDGLGARFWLATAEANACFALASSRSHDISLCAGYQAGLLNSRAFRFEVNDHKETLIQDLTLRLCATWWATASYGLHGALGVALPLMQDEFFGTREDGSRMRSFREPRLSLWRTSEFPCASVRDAAPDCRENLQPTAKIRGVRRFLYPKCRGHVRDSYPSTVGRGRDESVP